MGTTAALYLAAHHSFAGMVLHNPPPLRKLIMCRYGWWNLWILAGIVSAQVPSDLDSLKNAQQVTVPAVFIISGRDSLVPPVYQRQVADAYAGPKRLIVAEAAKHNTPLSSQARLELHEQLQWLWSVGMSNDGSCQTDQVLRMNHPTYHL
jgi:pimeloyl-ACP methyl ester carboxylesterase